MRTLAARRRVLCYLLLVLVVMPQAVLAGGVGVSEPPDSVVADTTLSTSGSNTITSVPFHLYKPRTDRSPRGHRDLELLWSDTYKSRFHMPLDSLSGEEQINDLQRLAETICEQNANPYGLPFTDIRLAYNMLAQQENYRDPLYDPLPAAVVGFRVAQPNYADADRAHLDSYVYAPSFFNHGQWGSYAGDLASEPEVGVNIGRFPSNFLVAAEDSLSGHSTPFDRNSIMLPGPLPSQVGATGASRWTRPGGTANAYLVHEGLHAINADPGFPANYLHMFASGAEVVTGVSTDAPRFDVDYHFSLTPSGANEGNAYPHWQSFMAYLAFNWRGTDFTPGGWPDDLLARWARAPKEERSLPGLSNRLRDVECPECAVYPAFDGLDGPARVQRLIHDWRVAHYVNSPTLAGGKYGFPPQFGFSPADQLGAWQDIDPFASDAYSIPPVVTMGPDPAGREHWINAHPGGVGYGPRTFDLGMFGAEYVVFNADAALSAQPRDLVIRVRTDLLAEQFFDVVVGAGCGVYDTTMRFQGLLHASVVTYGQTSGELFRHGDWATGVTTQSTTLDAVREDLTFRVPDFGGSSKAAVLVVSLGDGPPYARTGTAEFHIGNVPKTVNLNIGAALDLGVAPELVTVVADAPENESQAAWSADGTKFAFTRIEPDGTSRIYLRNSDGTGSVTPLRSASGIQKDPVWSPRGNQVAYTQDDSLSSIWFVELATGTPSQAFVMMGDVHGPAYSPDGIRLAYLREWLTTTYEPGPPHEGDPPSFGGVTHYAAEVRIHDLTSGTDSLVARFARPSEFGPEVLELQSLRWSADAKRLTFGHSTESEDSVRCYELDVRTRTLRNVSSLAPGARYIELSPGEGRLLIEETDRLAFEESCSPVAWAICGLCGHGLGDPPFRTTSALLDQVALRDTTQDSSFAMVRHSGVKFSGPRWSPDGTKVAYVTDANGNLDILVRAATNNRAPVMSASVQMHYTTYNCSGFTLALAAADPDGDAVSYRVIGLPAGAELANGHQLQWAYPVVGEYWFAAQALDQNGALASRLIRLSVYDGGDCSSGGGGGGEGEIIPGGGNSARIALQERLLRTGGSQTAAVNSLLDGAPAGHWVNQVARLSATKVDSAGGVTAGLVGLRAGEFKLDRARLVVVDHDPTVVAVATEEGVVIAEKRVPVEGAVSGGRTLESGASLILRWDDAAALEGLVVDCARAAPVDSVSGWGIRVEVPEGEGWRALGRILPRSGFDALAVSLEGARGARLLFDSPVQVREVTGYSLADAQEAEINTVDCAAASGEGTVGLLAQDDGAAVSLGRGQGLALQFAAPPTQPDKQRALFLEMTASFTPAAGGATQSSLGGTVPGARFALHSAAPNPFTGDTRLRLEVPLSTFVRVDVYDLLGRRARSVVKQELPAGVHTFEWDGVGDQGQRLAAGVYVVRMVADGFRAERRVVKLGE